MRVDRVAHHLLRLHVTLDLVLGALRGRHRLVVLRDGRCRKALGDQAAPLERRHCTLVQFQRARLDEHLGNGSIAVDQDQKAAQRNRQIELAIPQLREAELGLRVDF